jgi:hypothetical protein
LKNTPTNMLSVKNSTVLMMSVLERTFFMTSENNIFVFVWSILFFSWNKIELHFFFSEHTCPVHRNSLTKIIRKNMFPTIQTPPFDRFRQVFKRSI